MVKANKPIKMRVFLGFLFLLVIASSISKEKKDHPKTIVEANHFFSSQKKLASYDVENISKGKPLILLLKDIEKTNLLTDFSITLEEQAHKTSCEFKKKTDLCIIANVSSSKIKMGIQCHSLPCQITWVLYQPQPKDPSSNQIALNLFSLHDSKDHMIGQVTCNDPSITTLNADVSVYSEVPYKRAYKNNVLYLLFNNQKKGFVFIDIDTASRACANISFKEPSQVLSENSEIITNFIIKDSSVSYEIKEIPNKNIWLSCTSVRLDQIAQMKSSYKITLFGTIDAKQTEINTHQLAVSKSRSNDFTIVFKKPKEEYKNLRIEFNILTNQIVLFDTKYYVSDSVQVELGQTIFFNLKKDETLNFNVDKDEDAEDNQEEYFIPKRSQQVHLSKDKCLQKQNCQLTVTAVTDTQNMIFVSSRQMSATSITSEGQGLYEFEQIQFLTIKDKVKRKAKAGDNIFFKRTIKQNEAIQVHINTPNAIIYAACRSKCQVPDERCRQRTGNYHHPFVYQAKQDCQLLMNVEALDNTEFQLTIISKNQKYIALEDGTPFSYTMDSHEERIDFKFKLKEKSDVSFNLVSPLNSLKLFVSNGRQDVDEDTSEQSTDGYILIEKGNIDSLDFTVSVVKMKDYKPFFTHFTLIVSSKQTNLRLEPTVTNYQTLVASDSRDFYFQFDPTENYILSFYMYNLKNEKIDLELKISDQQKEWKDAQTLTISKQSDYLDLSELSQELCEGQGVQSCQIFLRITNKLTVEIDFTITLLSKNAVIQLKDGIWQAFPQTMLTASSNFYFYPRHEDKNIFIYYHSSFQDIRITYNLWKYDRQQAIDPIDWPFPKTLTENQKINADYKPSSYIIIDHELMKSKCWPNCLLLVSIYADISKMAEKKMPIIQSQYNNFKIMASNNQIQLPEDQKMSLTIGKDEQKTMLIDLKYAFDKQALNFYATSSIGNCYIRANVYSQQKPRCPLQDESVDFIISWGESQIEMAKIKQLLKEKGMDEDKNIYLCLGIHSTSSCKVSVQFSTKNQGFKKISTDSYEEVKLDAYEIKYYQIDGFIEQYAKITRISGFPFVGIKKCGQKNEYKQCMQDFKNEEQKGKQIVAKTSSFQEDFCVDCIYLFKFSTVQPSELNFHLQSKYTELQLKENNIISDFLNEGQTNKYQINANANEDLIINIHVQEGAIETQVTNLNGINLNKKSDSKNNILHFVIKSSRSYTNEQNGLMNPLAFSGDFVIYHVIIKSLDADKAASYTISYSSGNRELFLQDGLVVDYMLEPSKLSTFYYYNEGSNSHVYYSISMENATTLNQLKIKSYYLEDPNDQTSKTQISLQRPTISKKTPNPTILFSLPQKNYFSFELTNPSSKQQKISMAINHQQVILLPFNHQFPFQLHKGEELNLLVDINIPGYIETTIRKCDKSEPQFSFTFDYEEFLKGTFMSQTKITDSSYTYNVIKANRIGTLYINFKADAQEDTMISFKVNYKEQKSKKSRIIPGGKGAISYELLTEKTATIKVPLALCEDRKPCKGTTYYYLSSNNQNEVYSQLVCSSSFFSLWNTDTTKSLSSVKINGHMNEKELTFDFTMNESLLYLGVKVVAQNGEEAYYQPIQVASLWSKWLKVSFTQRLLMTLIILFSLTVCCIFCRRLSRKGYRPLDESAQY